MCLHSSTFQSLKTKKTVLKRPSETQEVDHSMPKWGTLRGILQSFWHLMQPIISQSKISISAKLQTQLTKFCVCEFSWSGSQTEQGDPSDNMQTMSQKTQTMMIQLLLCVLDQSYVFFICCSLQETWVIVEHFAVKFLSLMSCQQWKSPQMMFLHHTRLDDESSSHCRHCQQPQSKKMCIFTTIVVQRR